MEPKTLFLVGCIPARLALAWAASRNVMRPVFAYILLAIGAGFSYLYLSNTRIVAREAGGVTWWAPWRWVHAVLYLAAGLFLLLDRPYLAGRVLLNDALLGLLLHVVRYY